MAHLSRLLIENIEPEIRSVRRGIEMQTDGRFGVGCILDFMESDSVRDISDLIFVVGFLF